LTFDMNSHVRSASALERHLPVVLVFAALALLLALGSYQATIARLVEQVKLQRSQLKRQVGRDTLSGLPLMPLASDRLELALKHARHSGGKVGVLFVDLDGFKAINDGFGHAAGDHALQRVANRLRQAVREEDAVARVGGDEFVIVVAGLDEAASAARLAQNINRTVARSIEWQGHALQLGASVGIALYPEHAQDAQSLRRQADAALYAVKHSGKNGCGFAARRGRCGARRLTVPRGV